jgi:peptide-methionine (S)-S-oxide reductase
MGIPAVYQFMRRNLIALTALTVIVGCQSFAANPVMVKGQQVTPTGVGTRPGGIGSGQPLKPAPGDELAAFSGGCFWGTENSFRHVPGVVATAVGYTGGHLKNPSYEEVCTHLTGHAETVLVEFNPKKVSYRQLVDDFWNFHDPTTPNQQGPDFGSNYRSAIWVFSQDQMKDAVASMQADQKRENAPIVTEIHPIGPFWLAEDYHQQYDEKNGTNTCPIPRHGN